MWTIIMWMSRHGNLLILLAAPLPFSLRVPILKSRLRIVLACWTLAKSWTSRSRRRSFEGEAEGGLAIWRKGGSGADFPHRSHPNRYRCRAFVCLATMPPSFGSRLA